VYRARQTGDVEFHRVAVALSPYLVAGLCALPWVAYALPTSIQHTSRTISGVPPTPSVFTFLESLLVFTINGTFLDLRLSEILAVAGWALIAIVLVASRRLNRVQAAFALMVLGAAAIYLIAPPFGRPRFFIVLVPLLIVMFISGLALPRRGYRRLALPALGLIFLFALYPTGQVERGQFELDAVRLGEQLQQTAADGDAVLLQAWWQAGYLDLHGGGRLKMTDTRDVSKENLPGLIAGSRSVWLANFQLPARDRSDGPERWLDDIAYRVDERTIGPTRLVRYSLPNETAGDISLRYPNGLALSGQLPVSQVHDGDPLPAQVTISTTQQITDRYVVYLHLLDADGRGWAGRDGEPFDGAVPTDALVPGQPVVDRRGLTVPPGTPAGRYSVRAGVYKRSDGQKLAGIGGDEIELGTVEIVNAAEGASLATVEGLANLASIAKVRTDDYSAVRSTFDTVDGPQTVTAPYDARAGQALRIVLYWQATGSKAGLKTFVHLLNHDGTLLAQSDGVPAEGGFPTDKWQPGMRISDGHTLMIPPSATAGTYQIVAGVYDESGTRLPVASNGRRQPGDLIKLGSVTIAAS
jgi:hypothetical protein